MLSADAATGITVSLTEPWKRYEDLDVNSSGALLNMVYEANMQYKNKHVAWSIYSHLLMQVPRMHEMLGKGEEMMSKVMKHSEPSAEWQMIAKSMQQTALEAAKDALKLVRGKLTRKTAKYVKKYPGDGTNFSDASVEQGRSELFGEFRSKIRRLTAIYRTHDKEISELELRLRTGKFTVEEEMEAKQRWASMSQTTEVPSGESQWDKVLKMVIQAILDADSSRSAAEEWDEGANATYSSRTRIRY